MSGRSCRLFAVLASSAVLAGACADGYPTDDEALVLTYGMSREATLRAMNTIGQRAYLDDRWRYDLAEGCRLRIESRALSGGDVVLALVDASVQASVVDEPAPDSHTVFAHAPGSVPSSGTAALDSASWFDATQMKWLIDYLPVLCAAPPSPVR